MTQRARVRRQRLVRVLRSAGVLEHVDRARYYWTRLRNLPRNRAAQRDNPGIAFPPPHLAYDAYGTVHYHSYLAKGRAVAEFIGDIARRHLGDRPIDICEWGCGPGRIVRHLPRVLPRRSRVYGTDYNPATIEWCSQHVPDVTFRLNQLAPPLPLQDREVDFLFAISVLTHLSEELHYRWIADCRRVVRPGGLILLTAHGDRSSAELSPAEKARYDAGQIVVRGQVLEGSRTFVAFHSTPFMLRTLLQGLELVEHRQDTDVAGRQDVYIMRVPGQPSGGEPR